MASCVENFRLSKELNALDEAKEQLLADLYELRKRVAELGFLRQMSTWIRFLPDAGFLLRAQIHPEAGFYWERSCNGLR